MAPTGEEIRSRLSAFAAHWSVYEGSERSEAQTFLNELFACYGTRRADVAHFEKPQAGRFLDLIWSRVCLIEMKAPSEAKRLAKHREQALRYWVESADDEAGIPAPRFVVICAFRRMEIWEPGAFPKQPRLVLDLIDLPDQYDALLFLAGPAHEPVFTGGQAALTREAVVHLVDLYEQLKQRPDADPLFSATSFSRPSGVSSRRTRGNSRPTVSHNSSKSSSRARTGRVRTSSEGSSRHSTSVSRGSTDSTRVSRTPTAACSDVRHACTSSAASSNNCARRPASSGRRCSRRSSALCSKAVWDTTDSGRSALTTRTRPTYRRSCSRPSSSRGRSASRTCLLIARRLPRSRICSTTSSSILPAARGTSSMSPTASSGGSRSASPSERSSGAGRKGSGHRRA